VSGHTQIKGLSSKVASVSNLNCLKRKYIKCVFLVFSDAVDCNMATVKSDYTSNESNGNGKSDHTGNGSSGSYCNGQDNDTDNKS
jgi:hypothetical protein